MRISDWSSDVCSSDLDVGGCGRGEEYGGPCRIAGRAGASTRDHRIDFLPMFLEQPLGHFGRERSGVDGIHVDMGFGEEPGHVEGEMMHRRLTGGIGIIFELRRRRVVALTDVYAPHPARKSGEGG